MKNNKLSIESLGGNPVYAVIFSSRNKDNKHLNNFKERSASFITHKTPEELTEEFEDFVSRGREHEMCRMYYSISARDPQKIYPQLMHFLVDHPDVDLCYIAPKLASIAAQKSCALEKKWLFDFDLDSLEDAHQFMMDISIFSNDTVVPKLHKTPHGYAIVVDNRFDTRELMECWGDVATLKRDGFLCSKWKTKGE